MKDRQQIIETQRPRNYSDISLNRFNKIITLGKSSLPGVKTRLFRVITNNE